MILAPTPTARQTLEALFQLVLANAPGAQVPQGQRIAVANAAEDLFVRYVEGTVRAAVAAHAAAEAAAFDARVAAVVSRLTEAPDSATEA